MHCVELTDFVGVALVGNVCTEQRILEIQVAIVVYLTVHSSKEGLSISCRLLIEYEHPWFIPSPIRVKRNLLG